MKSIVYSISTAIAVGLFAAPLCAVDAPKPNIVHIMVDDLGWQDIASHKIDGNPVYETPHLDRLTREGRRFTQAYSPSASCAPSRVAFLRGQNPANTGVYHVSGGQIPRPWTDGSNRICPYYVYGLPVEEPMIPESLKKAGYISGHVGKWHAGGKSAGYPFPLDQGFDFGFSERNGNQKYYNDPELWNPSQDKKDTFFGNWASIKPDRLSNFATSGSDDPYQLDEDGRPFDKPLDLALGFMRKNKGEPFFLNFCPYLVHGPIGTRDRKRFEHYLQKMGYDFPTDPGSLDKGKSGHTNPYYATMVDTLDWMVGEVMEYLETTDDPRNPGHKLIDNTYLIVDSDNGGVIPYTDNAPLKGGKQQTYEGGIRIPFLVKGPGVESGSICETPINLIDLYPTFMEMAGLPADPTLELDGYNILPLIQGTSDKVVKADGSIRESLYWFFPWDAHMSSSLRKNQWKLVKNYGGWMGSNADAKVQLYRLYNDDGLANDLGEAQDVADQYPELARSLLAELDQEIEKTGAPEPRRNSNAKSVTPEELAALPAVLELGSERDRVWVTLESGAEKSTIREAQLLYTMNPKPLDSTRGHREEWHTAPAKITQGKVEALMPPGATHAAFAMVDANRFLINSEPMPAVKDVGHELRNSNMLENGFAYKPGLFALIELGQKAQLSAEAMGQDVTALKKALNAAKPVYKRTTASDEAYCDAIRNLRASIRNLKGTSESAHPAINRFPTDLRF